ncbi:hypothetical protein [Bacillus sp. Cr_A10]|uniref:hypothetical protein n=1 Tax=Bacillus sp. Cr_A10 TaxID=3033993 RepID=UPI0023DCE11E|nr:hypothetical protein [Bacillus sp. Cr_A10]MDF2068212.1 hypothetical protein [Bacillus sp. Cr_A10]
MNGTNIPPNLVFWENHDQVISSINELAEEIRNNSSILIVTGFGELYYATKMYYEGLKAYFNSDANIPEIIFAGEHRSGLYINQLIQYIAYKDVYINVISNSGSVNGPPSAYRLLRAYMERRYRYESTSRVIVTTDGHDDAYKVLATERENRTFVIPRIKKPLEISPVGLLPLAVAGCDVEALQKMCEEVALKLLKGNHELSIENLYKATKEILSGQK